MSSSDAKKKAVAASRPVPYETLKDSVGTPPAAALTPISPSQSASSTPLAIAVDSAGAVGADMEMASRPTASSIGSASPLGPTPVPSVTSAEAAQSPVSVNGNGHSYANGTHANGYSIPSSTSPTGAGVNGTENGAVSISIDPAVPTTSHRVIDHNTKNAEEQASFFGKIWFSWLSPLIWYKASTVDDEGTSLQCPLLLHSGWS
jgi:hypothetical protein